MKCGLIVSAKTGLCHNYDFISYFRSHSNDQISHYFDLFLIIVIYKSTIFSYVSEMGFRMIPLAKQTWILLKIFPTAPTRSCLLLSAIVHYRTLLQCPGSERLSPRRTRPLYPQFPALRQDGGTQQLRENNVWTLNIKRNERGGKYTQWERQRWTCTGKRNPEISFAWSLMRRSGARERGRQQSAAPRRSVACSRVAWRGASIVRWSCVVLFIIGKRCRSSSHTIVPSLNVFISCFEYVMWNKITFYFAKCFCG